VTISNGGTITNQQLRKKSAIEKFEKNDPTKFEDKHVNEK
jgi:hypothetical protein